MSRIRESEIEALRIRLSCCKGESIFGKGSSQAWMKAYQSSYEYSEHPGAEWPKLTEIRSRVKNQLTAELPLITEREEALLRRILLFGGASPLFSDDEMPAADSLIRRLWCSCITRDNGQLIIRLADVLLKPVLMILVGDDYSETRKKVYALSATLHSMVYLHGMLYAEPIISHMLDRLLTKRDNQSINILYRYLKAEFDYCFDSQGNLVLMHAGLIHPERMLASISHARYQAADYTKEMIIGGISELLKEEAAAENILKSELGFALQPGYNAGMMVNDIKFLIKQGATHDQLSALVSDKLAVRMTPSIENALKRVETDTVRWQSYTDRRLN